MKKLITFLLSLTLLIAAPAQQVHASSIDATAMAAASAAQTIGTEKHVHQITVNEPSTFEKIAKGVAAVFVAFWVGFVGFHLVD